MELDNTFAVTDVAAQLSLPLLGNRHADRAHEVTLCAPGLLKMTGTCTSYHHGPKLALLEPTAEKPNDMPFAP